MTDLARPRAVTVALDAALYESHYLTAIDPAGGRALWLRHTALKRRGQPAHPTVWLVWFDRSAPAPRAWRVTAPEPLADPGGAWARSALGELAPTAATGAVNGVAWSLHWQARAPELPYLPARWLYDRAIPRSNGVALVPAATVTGTVTLDGQAPVALDGWDGMAGHNWGSEHAEQWTWIHAGGLGDDRGGWLDLALVRVRVGRLLTPWLAAGAAHLAGRTHATARRGRVRREIDGEHTRIAVPLAGGARIELQISAPAAATAVWDYASPAGSGRAVRNCSVADASVHLHADGGERRLTISGGLAVEHGEPLARPRAAEAPPA
jgi:hypothetical protein